MPSEAKKLPGNAYSIQGSALLVFPCFDHETSVAATCTNLVLTN